jgi:archaellum component FlaC
MTRDEIFKLADYLECNDASMEAQCAAAAELRRLSNGVETLFKLYEQVCQQRDELMDQQRAQVSAMRGRIQ